MTSVSLVVIVPWCFSVCSVFFIYFFFFAEWMSEYKICAERKTSISGCQITICQVFHFPELYLWLLGLVTFYIDCNLWRQSKERKNISGNCTGVRFAASVQAAEAFSHIQTFKDCEKYISALSSVTIPTQTVVLCEGKKNKTTFPLI